MDNIPINGPFIVASNHTSNYDPILFIGILTKKIHFLAKRRTHTSALVEELHNREIERIKQSTNKTMR